MTKNTSTTSPPSDITDIPTTPVIHVPVQKGRPAISTDPRGLVCQYAEQDINDCPIPSTPIQVLRYYKDLLDKHAAKPEAATPKSTFGFITIRLDSHKTHGHYELLSGIRIPYDENKFYLVNPDAYASLCSLYINRLMMPILLTMNSLTDATELKNAYDLFFPTETAFANALVHLRSSQQLNDASCLLCSLVSRTYHRIYSQQSYTGIHQLRALSQFMFDPKKNNRLSELNHSDDRLQQFYTELIKNKIMTVDEAHHKGLQLESADISPYLIIDPWETQDYVNANTCLGIVRRIIDPNIQQSIFRGDKEPFQKIASRDSTIKNAPWLYSLRNVMRHDWVRHLDHNRKK